MTITFTQPGNWYQTAELMEGLTLVNEPKHANFYALTEDDEGLLVDSGFGFSDDEASTLFDHLGIRHLRTALSTHIHFDHTGLNHRVERAYVPQSEWESYDDEKRQEGIRYYHAMFKDRLPWPIPKDQVPTQQPWTPAGFIEPHSCYQLGSWNLQVIQTPGHTAGHVGFYDFEKRVAFLGDFMYKGALWLHVRESSMPSYMSSLRRLMDLMASNPGDWLLLGGHSYAVIEPDRPARTLDTLQKIMRGDLQPVGQTNENLFLDSAFIYKDEANKITVYVKKTDVAHLLGAHPEWAGLPVRKAIYR